MSSRIQVDLNIKEITEDLERAVETRMKNAVYRVHRELVQNILKGNRSGREYPVPGTRPSETRGTSAGEGRKPKKTKFYTASAPGEAPAVRLGDLRTSYRPRVEGKGFKAVGKVGTPLKYGAYLEEGTARIAKRPHIKPAFEQSRPDWIKEFDDLI
jgi:hypothetical protein